MFFFWPLQTKINLNFGKNLKRSWHQEKNNRIINNNKNFFFFRKVLKQHSNDLIITRSVCSYPLELSLREDDISRIAIRK